MTTAPHGAGPLDRLLTVEEVAAWMQVKPRTIYQWVHERRIPVIKLSSCVRFDKAKLAEWLKKQEVPARASRRYEVDIN